MILTVLLGAVAVLDLVVLARLLYAFRLLAYDAPDDDIANELPSVTVCIAARNETHAMTQCLERVVATEYPKLEVIVLDDGSRDDTSLLIKSFAYAGVRFVEGKPLPGGWLGKNYAQSLLAREASGEYVFFMDVDTLIERHTVTRTVHYLRRHKATMVSIIPMRSDAWQTSSLMTTMRHFWAVLRFRPHRPRATANAWMIDRDVLLERLAADTGLSHSMELETRIARYLAPAKKYRLICSNAQLGVRYEKRWSSQIETSIRLLYPQCERTWYRVGLLIVMLALALVPYAAIVFTPWAWLLVLAQYGIAVFYLSRTWRRFMMIGAVIVPVTIMQEIILLAVSSYRYTFGTITWKGRPITSK